jgi:hypothetical protein
MMKLVHFQKEHHDIYIGRPSKWGNPYTHIKDRETKAEFIVDTREEAIAKYRDYILKNETLMNSLHELEGKILGCWCYPNPCHGEVLIDLVRKNAIKRYFEANK